MVRGSIRALGLLAVTAAAMTLSIVSAGADLKEGIKTKATQETTVHSKFTKDSRVIGTLNVDQYTKAPVQAYAVARVNLDPEKLFVIASDHENLGKWVPGIDHVTVDFFQCEVPGKDGVGTVRICHVGGMDIVEKTVHWDPPYVYASTSPDMMGLTDTMGAIYVESDGHGGSIISMRKYYSTEAPSDMASGIQKMMQNPISAGLMNLVKEFGGEMIEEE